MDKVGKPTSVMIDISSEEELINPLISRGQVSGRSDDKIEVVKHRFEVYRKEPLLSKTSQSINKYVSVDGVVPSKKYLSASKSIVIVIALFSPFAVEADFYRLNFSQILHLSASL